jgi:16S rRNA (uracil1498-N3)-methyltransferase
MDVRPSGDGLAGGGVKKKVLHHQRFYAPQDAVRGDLITFPRDERLHMAASLRLAKHDLVSVTDGCGTVYEAEIEEASGRSIVARILKTVRVCRPAHSILLMQGTVRPAKLDLLVAKCAELGVSGIVPVRCERSVRQAAEERQERWNRIAIEAMKQSLRAYLPRVDVPQPFETALRLAADLDLNLVASEAPGGRSLLSVLPKTVAAIGLWVGPEGGFSDAEMRALLDAGAQAYSLGPARLRSETAALASVAIIQEYLR